MVTHFPWNLLFCAYDSSLSGQLHNNFADHSRILPGSFPSVLVWNLKYRKDIFISDFSLATVKLSIFVLFCILLYLQNLRRQSTVQLYIVHYFKQLKLTNATDNNVILQSTFVLALDESFIKVQVFYDLTCCLVVTFCEGLTSWLSFVMFNCVFVTFPCGILGQVWYLIVSIPDLCHLSYSD